MADNAPTTRDRLLEAARELFTTLGYHATTTPILAKRAGVAEGTIYRHFPAKQALLNAAYQESQRWGSRPSVTRVPGGREDGWRAAGRRWAGPGWPTPKRSGAGPSAAELAADR